MMSDCSGIFAATSSGTQLARFSRLPAQNDIWAGKRENRANWVPEDVAAKIPEQSDIIYFAGCTASYVETDIAEASIRLLQDAGYSVGYWAPTRRVAVSR